VSMEQVERALRIMHTVFTEASPRIRDRLGRRHLRRS
jgi:hypothetical protein